MPIMADSGSEADDKLSSIDDKIPPVRFDVDCQGELDYDEFAGNVDRDSDLSDEQVRSYDNLFKVQIM